LSWVRKEGKEGKTDFIYSWGKDHPPKELNPSDLAGKKGTRTCQDKVVLRETSTQRAREELGLEALGGVVGGGRETGLPWGIQG